MSYPIVTTPEQTPSRPADSRHHGPPTTCPSESSQLVFIDSQPERRPIQGRKKPRLAPPGHSLEEITAAFYAKIAENIALQELWFSVMVRRSHLFFHISPYNITQNTPIPGYPDIKPPPKTSLTLKNSAANVNKPRYPRRTINRI